MGDRHTSLKLQRLQTADPKRLWVTTDVARVVVICLFVVIRLIVVICVFTGLGCLEFVVFLFQLI